VRHDRHRRWRGTGCRCAFDIEEGEITRIADINIIGAKAFSERELRARCSSPRRLAHLDHKDEQ